MLKSILQILIRLNIAAALGCLTGENWSWIVN